MAISIQQGVSTSGLSTTKRAVLQVRAGNAYAEAYNRDTSWKQLIELWHIKQETVDYVANLNSLVAARFSGEYNFAGSLVGKQTMTMYSYDASVRVKEELIKYNLIPSLSSLAADVGDAMGEHLGRFVFNSYSGGNAIQCLDAVGGTIYLYDTTHGDGSQNNALTATFGEVNLEAAINQMAGLMDHTGKKQIGTMPDVILLNPSNMMAAEKLLRAGTIVVTGQITAAATANTRIGQSLFGGITPIYSTLIHADEFILINTKMRKKPFIFNLPDGGDGTTIRNIVDTRQDLLKTRDWQVTAIMDIGMCATECWFGTLTSGTSHNTPWDVAVTASDL